MEITVMYKRVYSFHRTRCRVLEGFLNTVMNLDFL